VLFLANFPERLSQLRKEKKITQRALAEHIGVNTRNLQYYEAGDKRPELEGLIKIAEFFNVTLDYLVGKTDDPIAPRREPDNAESEFKRWVEENLEDEFYYDFDASPEESKAQMMADLRYLWEREKKRNKK